MSKDLEEELEELKLRKDIQSNKTEIEREKALIKEMRQKYGSGWRRIIGYNRRNGVGLLESLSKARFKI